MCKYSANYYYYYYRHPGLPCMTLLSGVTVWPAFVTDVHSCMLQPYRTTPLVLPGAKVKKDAVTTTSYLRHHPNPKFRAPPSHYDTSAEVLMKQKVNLNYTFWQYETTK